MTVSSMTNLLYCSHVSLQLCCARNNVKKHICCPKKFFVKKLKFTVWLLEIKLLSLLHGRVGDKHFKEAKLTERLPEEAASTVFMDI